MKPIDIMLMGRRAKSAVVQFINAFSTQNGSSGTSLAIATSSIVASDFLIGAMGNTSASTWTGDTGWTEHVDQGAKPSLRVASLTPGSSGNPTYTYTGSANGNLGGSVLQYRGAQIDVVGSVAASLTASAITPSNGATVLLFAFIDSGNRTLTAPAGWTQRAQNSDATAPSWAVFERDALSDGTSTGTVTVSSSGGGTSATLLMSIKPA